MTLVPSARGSFWVSGHFTDSSDRILKGANVYFLDAYTGAATAVDSITLTVEDSAGTNQYVLTTSSTPAIELELPGPTYVVDSIDVTGFPDGDITLTWVGSYDGYEYEASQTVAFNNAPDMLFVSGQTATLHDYSVVIEQSKTYTLRVVDSVGNPVDGYVRGVFYDKVNLATTLAVTATQAGTGLYTFTTALSSATFTGGLDRYELYWQFRLTEAGDWYEVANSRVPLQIYGETSNVAAGPIAYNTNESLRRSFPGIDRFLESVVANQGEREAWLNHKRWEVGLMISLAIKNSRARVSRDLLQVWADYETYKVVLLDAHAFARFAVDDTQLKHLNRRIVEIRNRIFGPVSTIRIGPRS